MRVAVHPWYTQLLDNGGFDPGHPLNHNGGLDRWIHARRRLAAQGIHLDTYDRFADARREADGWIIHEPGFEQLKFMARNRIHPRRAVAVMIEPPVIHAFPWRWVRWVHRTFGAVLSWHSRAHAGHRNTVPYWFPTEPQLDRYPGRRATTRDNTFVLMRSNKASSRAGEHYSFRREIIKHFDGRRDDLLDLFGPGWNDPTAPDPLTTRLYRGTSEDKRATYSRYAFAFCFDNSTEPGYVTQDALTAMSAATVPIYWPPADIDAHLPRGTYIDFRRFGGLSDVTDYALSIIGTEEYDRYLERAERFLRSDLYWRFTNEAFYASVHHALKRVGAPGDPPPLPSPLAEADHARFEAPLLVQRPR